MSCLLLLYRLRLLLLYRLRLLLPGCSHMFLIEGVGPDNLLLLDRHSLHNMSTHCLTQLKLFQFTASFVGRPVDHRGQKETWTPDDHQLVPPLSLVPSNRDSRRFDEVDERHHVSEHNASWERSGTTVKHKDLSRFKRTPPPRGSGLRKEAKAALSPPD
ncbi:unnamed protein product [Pleuronectes platessa]|uniref:Secreted protein n=1 Tax=Pleuronectes platessa TaxID=8262 RepID=A0A9N7ULV0_PLEPL|nr:unnamed protein product [Pleuronectes platessa]